MDFSTRGGFLESVVMRAVSLQWVLGASHIVTLLSCVARAKVAQAPGS